MRIALISLTLALAGPAALEAAPAPRPKPTPQTPEPKPPEPKAPEPGAPEAKALEQLQREADHHFKSGVALFKEAKYAEALAEFERAYEIAPHPLVLYNIAGCHRELSHYAEAVTYYGRFLSEGNGKVPAARLAVAQADLNALLTLIARVTVTITPANPDASLLLDGSPLVKPAMPLILTPGEHRLVAHVAGKRDAERTLQLGAGDTITIDLPLGELPLTPPGKVTTVAQVEAPSLRASSSRRWLAVDAGVGMNLRRLGNTGAPSIGLGAEIDSRFSVGVEVVLVAYAVVPSLRVRVAGDALSLHLIGAMPIVFSDDPMTGQFFAVAGGLGVRYRQTSRLAFRLESYVSVAGKSQGTTVPTFLGGELWF